MLHPLYHSSHFLPTELCIQACMTILPTPFPSMHFMSIRRCICYINLVIQGPFPGQQTVNTKSLHTPQALLPPKPHTSQCLPGSQCGMHRHLCQDRAIDAVKSIGRHGSNHVRWIDVPRPFCDHQTTIKKSNL